MQRRAIIHLGLPKCGSSALQVRLRANVDTALEHGAFYPLLRRDGGKKSEEKGSFGMGHMALATDLVQASKAGQPSEMLADILDDFDRSAANALILSSESFARRFAGITSEAITPLIDRDLAVDLVLFTRRADAHAVSTYKQVVRRRRYTETFRKFVDGSETGDTMRSAMNVGRAVGDAKRLFPKATFHLFDLDASGGDSIALFGKVAGLPLAEWSSDPAPTSRNRTALLVSSGRAVNQSHSDAKTLFLIACNRSDMKARALKEIDMALIQIEDLPPHPDRILNIADAQRLLDTFRRSNAAVETEFGIPLVEHGPMTGLGEGEPRAALTGEEMHTLSERLTPLVSEATAGRLRAAFP